jgi:hypothetical protein
MLNKFFLNTKSKFSFKNQTFIFLKEKRFLNFNKFNIKLFTQKNNEEEDNKIKIKQMVYFLLITRKNL